MMTGSFTKNKLKSMEKLNRSKKKFKWTSIISLVVDVISFYTFSILRYLYKIQDTGSYDLVLLMNTLFIHLVINIVLIVLVLQEKRRVLLIFMLMYIVLGTSYAIIVLILHFEIKNSDTSSMKPSYLNDNAFLAVIIFNSLSWICKACSSISIGLFYFFNENFESEYESTNCSRIEYQGKRVISKCKPKSDAAKIANIHSIKTQKKVIQEVLTDSFISTNNNKYDEPEPESREILIVNDFFTTEQRKSNFLEKIHFQSI